jgi:antitoxin (DNA-binding transcriptional repressor) of toxin-antitoxin stability system
MFCLLSNMKAVDVRNPQHRLGSFLDQVEAGETLEIRRRKIIARIVPCIAESPAESWPDLAARLERLYPEGPVGQSASDILYQDWGD